jgi:hypothetical protein
MAACRRQRGETLAEILVSVTILGIVAVGVVGALASNITVSSADRNTSTAEPIMRSFGAWVETSLGSAGGFRPCSTNGSPANPYFGTGVGQYTSPAIGFTVPESAPSGTTVRVRDWGANSGVKFWNGSQTASFATTCTFSFDPASPGYSAPNLQQLVVEVRVPGGSTLRSTVELRKP